MSELFARRDTELIRADQMWTEVLAFVDSLTPDERDDIRNADGWSAKDHVTHLAAWKRSFRLWIDNISGHDAIGVSKELFDGGDLHLVNAAIFEMNRDLSWQQVSSSAVRDHVALIDHIRAQSETRLLEPLGRRSLIDAIPYLTRKHDQVHLRWMKRSFAQAATISSEESSA